ncbi:Enkurin, putative [Perkinsus marinus ATCC 50983]|uniref:Enkurin, putative n=1 Tax=Perkinsus marinus (strain ATCC 50983 / TXsc) TaxID=423536 RepID=C5LQH0_PERM5|nr:Enkurin, putative [Perkinsus marinus ATCC 50983]EER01016.1 Enkurin, putative [Perkinsus marinus ATCC 50983]|eukprot:XP_002768298.1 Enkurin, putative [Perkinsus marinus ATCC 50983]
MLPPRLDGDDDDGPHESVYGLVIEPELPKPKPARHKSKYSATIPPTSSTFTTAQTSKPGISNVAGSQEVERPKPTEHIYYKPHATFGVPVGSAKPDPKKPLRKFDKNRRIESLTEIRKKSPEKLKATVAHAAIKPALPKSGERPVMNLVSGKNFITANAVDNILKAPPPPVEGGEYGELAKDYLRKSDYGKVPAYLEKIKADIKSEYDYIRQLQDQQRKEEQGKIRPLPDEERLELIEALKKKWEKVNADYQCMTHLTKLDTIGKTRRKESFEAQLAAIENDIAKLNRRRVLIDTSM